MSQYRHGTLVQNVVIVRAGQDPARPHMGTLTIGDWTVPCATGRGGLRWPNEKKEGDGATPIGIFPLRYGMYDPDVFDASLRGLDFPFIEKPEDYFWSEDPASPFYNQFTFETDETRPKRRGQRIFDLIVPIGFNDSVVTGGGGSAIFMHAAREDFSGTAGCVVVAHDQLEQLARRLKPGMHIDIAPADAEPAERCAPEVAAAPHLESVTFHGLEKGPRVIVTGSVHGNEPAGPIAIRRLIAEFRSGKRRLKRGRLTFVPVVNALAFARNTRNGERNLNRLLAESAIPQDNEDRVANALCPLLRDNDALIDLHSFGSEGAPFACFGPTDNDGAVEPFHRATEEERLAKSLGLPLLVYGWLPAHVRANEMKRAAGVTGLSPLTGVGTTEYMRSQGGYGVTVECGQHSDPQGPQIAYDVVVNGLTQLGLIDGGATRQPLPRVIEITDAILAAEEGDRLLRRFVAGDAVTAGEVIGTRADGAPITAPYDGAVIFASLTAPKNTELCFLCRDSDRLG